MKSCPKGYTCDPKQETCQLNGSDEKKSITNLSTCPPDSTSCKNTNGDEVCCPYTNGTCCGPHGYWYDIILYKHKIASEKY